MTFKSQVNRASSADKFRTQLTEKTMTILMSHHIRHQANLIGDIMIYTDQVLPSDRVTSTIEPGFSEVTGT
jgi:hypothetical protein